MFPKHWIRFYTTVLLFITFKANAFETNCPSNVQKDEFKFPLQIWYSSSIAAVEIDCNSLSKFGDICFVDPMNPIHISVIEQTSCLNRKKLNALIYENNITTSFNKFISGNFGFRVCALERLFGFAFVQYTGLSVHLFQQKTNNLYAKCEWVGISDGTFIYQNRTITTSFNLCSKKASLTTNIFLGMMYSNPKTNGLLHFYSTNKMKEENSNLPSIALTKNMMAFAGAELQYNFYKKHIAGVSFGVYKENKLRKKILQQKVFYSWIPSEKFSIRFSCAKIPIDNSWGNFDLKLSIQE